MSSDDFELDPNEHLIYDEGAWFQIIDFQSLRLSRFNLNQDNTKPGIVIKTKLEESDGRRFPKKTFFLFDPMVDVIENKKVSNAAKGSRVAVKLEFLCRENDKVYLVKTRN